MPVRAEQQQSQQLALNQQLQLSLQLLALGSDALRETLNEELSRNPALVGDFYSMPLLSTGGPELENRAATRPQTLAEELEFQLGAERRPVDLHLAKQLIALLDENGYLRISAPAIAKAAGAPLPTVQATLQLLRGYEPAGVFAFDLSDCLLLQARRRGDAPQAALRIIEDGLELLAEGGEAVLAAHLGITRQEVERAAAYIRTLQPKPGGAYGGGEPQYVHPDLEVVFQNGVLTVRELRAWRLELNPDYERMPKEADAQTRAYLRQETGRARRLLRAVRQRSDTLLRIGQLAVERQAGWFLEGKPLQPLNQSELARRLGLHESTISRAVKDKYFMWEKRAVPLRALLCQSLPGGQSPDGAKAALRALIRGEAPDHPYSDEALAALLARQGIAIRRRTVAKYRAELGLATAGGRKRQGARQKARN